MSNHWHKTPISLLVPCILAKFPENSIDFQVLPEGYANPNTNPNKQELLPSFFNMHQSPIHISSNSVTLFLSESIGSETSLLNCECLTRSKQSVLSYCLRKKTSKVMFYAPHIHFATNLSQQWRDFFHFKPFQNYNGVILMAFSNSIKFSDLQYQQSRYKSQNPE